MNKLTIHVGLHKTATTFLQTSVFPYVENHTFVTRPYTQLNHAFNKLQYADDTLYSSDDLRESIDEIGADKLILSDESFSGKPTFFSYINRSLIAYRLAELFPDANIILFIRDQKDIMISHYSSYIKMPYGTAKIVDLYRKPTGTFNYQQSLADSSTIDHDTIYYNTNDYHMSLDCFKYAPLVNLYSRLFDNLHVFTYEDFKTDINATVERLEEILGDKINVKSTERENKSLSGSMLAKQRILNNVLSPRSSRYVRKALSTGLKILPPLPADDLQAKMNKHVGDFYSADNALLKELLPDIDWAKYPNKYE